MTQLIVETVAKARQDCCAAGVRLTAKRENVLTILLEHDHALSAYDVVDLYSEGFGEALSAMSVYRMLGFLVDNRLVHKLETTNQFIACAHIRCDHEHEESQFLICDDCHRVTEVGINTGVIDELRRSVADTDFYLPRQQLELHGLCRECKHKK